VHKHDYLNDAQGRPLMLLALLVIVGYFLVFGCVLLAATAGAIQLVQPPFPPH